MGLPHVRYELHSFDVERQETLDCSALGVSDFHCASAAIAGYASREITPKWGVF